MKFFKELFRVILIIPSLLSFLVGLICRHVVEGFRVGWSNEVWDTLWED